MCNAEILCTMLKYRIMYSIICTMLKYRVQQWFMNAVHLMQITLKAIQVLRTKLKTKDSIKINIENILKRYASKNFTWKI